MVKLEYIDKQITDGFKDVNEHLKTLNGQVAKNTTHRNEQNVRNKVGTYVLTSLFGILSALVMWGFIQLWKISNGAI